MDVVLEDDFIRESKNYLINEYNASGDFNITDLGEGFSQSMLVSFKNPGWSISRASSILTDLYKHMNEYCELNNCMECLDKFVLYIE